MKKILFLLLLVSATVNAQPLMRNRFTTNQNPDLIITANPAVNTNWIINQRYTNNTLATWLVWTDFSEIGAAVVGSINMSIYGGTNGSATILYSNRVQVGTLLTSLVMTNRVQIGSVINGGQWFYFTNDSSGSGNSTTLIPGSGYYATISGTNGAPGATGSPGPAGPLPTFNQYTINTNSPVSVIGASNNNAYVNIVSDYALNSVGIVENKNAAGINAIDFANFYPVTSLYGGLTVFSGKGDSDGSVLFYKNKGGIEVFHGRTNSNNPRPIDFIMRAYGSYPGGKTNAGWTFYYRAGETNLVDPNLGAINIIEGAQRFYKFDKTADDITGGAIGTNSIALEISPTGNIGFGIPSQSMSGLAGSGGRAVHLYSVDGLPAYIIETVGGHKWSWGIGGPGTAPTGYPLIFRSETMGANYVYVLTNGWVGVGMIPTNALSVAGSATITGPIFLPGAGTPGAGKVLQSDAAGGATWGTPAGGTFLANMTTSVTAAGTSETNLMVYTVPAATLAVNGSSLLIRASGSFTANTDAKQLKIKFGGTTLLDTTSLVLNGVDWVITAEITRTGATTQIANTTFMSGSATLSSTVTFSSPGETLANAIDVKCTGTSAGTGDILQKSMTIQKVTL